MNTTKLYRNTDKFVIRYETQTKEALSKEKVATYQKKVIDHIKSQGGSHAGIQFFNTASNISIPTYHNILTCAVKYIKQYFPGSSIVLLDAHTFQKLEVPQDVLEKIHSDPKKESQTNKKLSGQKAPSKPNLILDLLNCIGMA